MSRFSSGENDCNDGTWKHTKLVEHFKTTVQSHFRTPQTWKYEDRRAQSTVERTLKPQGIQPQLANAQLTDAQAISSCVSKARALCLEWAIEPASRIGSSGTMYI